MPLARPSFARLAAVLLLSAAPPSVLAADDPAVAEDAASGVVRGTVPVGKGLEPTVAFLKDVPGDYAARVRPVRIEGGALSPKVVVAAVGDVVKFVNADGQVHAVTSIEAGYDLGLLEKGETRGQLFLRPGAFPQRCAIHKELLGWIFVGANPYAAVADRQGAFEIRDVPGGKYAVGAWTAGAARIADGGLASSGGLDLSVPLPPPPPGAKLLRAAGVPKEKERPRAETGTIRGTVKAEPARFLEETVVYLKQVPGTFAPRKLAMDQKKMKFVPHVLPVTAGDTVRFLNNDGLAHNVYSNDGEGYNLGMFKDGEERPYTFKTGGVYSQLCNIHPDMLAYVFVGQNPFAAVVDASGRFEIPNVPPGQYTLAVWNSHLAPVEKPVTVERGGVVEAAFTVKR